MFEDLVFIPTRGRHLLGDTSESSTSILVLSVRSSIRPVCGGMVTQGGVIGCVGGGAFFKHPVCPQVGSHRDKRLLGSVCRLAVPNVSKFVCPGSAGNRSVCFVNGLLRAMRCRGNFPVKAFGVVPLVRATNTVVGLGSVYATYSEIMTITFKYRSCVASLRKRRSSGKRDVFVTESLVSTYTETYGVCPVSAVRVGIRSLRSLRDGLVLSGGLKFRKVLMLGPGRLPLMRGCFSPAGSRLR